MFVNLPRSMVTRRVSEGNNGSWLALAYASGYRHFRLPEKYHGTLLGSVY